MRSYVSTVFAFLIALTIMLGLAWYSGEDFSERSVGHAMWIGISLYVAASAAWLVRMSTEG
jgi:hypothetical protein